MFYIIKLLAISVLCILELCSGLVDSLEIIPVDSCFKMQSGGMCFLILGHFGPTVKTDFS